MVNNISNMYMLGDYLLVGAFDMHMNLPEGKWTDYFTGKTYEGEFEYEIPEGKGGALFVKAGAILVTQPPMLHLDEKLPEVYNIDLFPGEKATFSLIEDDGITYAYKDGAYCHTEMRLDKFDGKELTFKIDERKGEFDGMPDLTDFAVKVHGIGEPSGISLNGNSLEYEYCADCMTLSFTIDSKIRESDICVKITY